MGQKAFQSGDLQLVARSKIRSGSASGAAALAALSNRANRRAIHGFGANINAHLSASANSSRRA
jgi:hypothetical protein